jgi:predicted transcriptional regulator
VKRSRDIIMSQILEICAIGASKTKIVYQANLNFRTINPYLELLTKNGLIEVRREKTLIYETTPKGLGLLNNFKLIQDELSSADVAADCKKSPKEDSNVCISAV